MTVLTVKDFRLESGSILSEISLAYQTFGTLNADKSNVVWVCHALTANSNVCDWWEGLFGENKTFDPKESFIVCVNSIGSCYGSTGPKSALKNRRPLLDKFPFLTTRDAANAFDAVRKSLEIESISVLIGASLGGQQALEWSIQLGARLKRLVLIATNAKHAPYGIAFNESQRLAIAADPTYGNGNLHGGRNGLIAARSMALLSYRSPEIYNESQSDDSNDIFKDFRAASYQKYQGEKLANRFNAYSYVCLSRMMDSHNVGRNRDGVEAALNLVVANTLVVGIASDHLFPPSEQQFLAAHIAQSEYIEITSKYGHDGFLIETEQLAEILKDFQFNQLKKFKPTVFRSTRNQAVFI